MVYLLVLLRSRKGKMGIKIKWRRESNKNVFSGLRLCCPGLDSLWTTHSIQVERRYSGKKGKNVRTVADCSGDWSKLNAMCYENATVSWTWHCRGRNVSMNPRIACLHSDFQDCQSYIIKRCCVLVEVLLLWRVSITEATLPFNWGWLTGTEVQPIIIKAGSWMAASTQAWPWRSWEFYTCSEGKQKTDSSGS